MSIAAEAAALVKQRGAANVDDLMPDMPGYTRSQVLRALKTALDAGLIDSDGWTGPSHGGSKPATYRAIKKTSNPRVASVWELAGMNA